MKRFCLAFGLLLVGCASQPAGYLRADGKSSDPSQMQLVLAQCRGEGATAVADYVTGEGAIPWAAGMASRSSKETAVINGCMARNGYLAQ